MRGPSWLGFGLAVGVAAASCGGHTARSGARPNDEARGGSTSGAGGATASAGVSSVGGAARVPEKHRPSGSACPSERGTPSAPPVCQPGEEALCRCATDADCTQGSNGRCFQDRFGTSCSYDDCLGDADCGERVACECRASPLDTNSCQSHGDCAVDADCGPGGYCSPSVLNPWVCTCPSPALCSPPDPHAACDDACGHGYFCHTPTDACLDQSDCPGADECGYDTVERRFVCHSCLPIP